MNKDIESENNYEDMESELDRLGFSEKDARVVRNIADFFIAKEQLKNKGDLLGHYKSVGILKTYIDIYERAIIGRAEIRYFKRTEYKDIQYGYSYLARATAEGRVLYLVTNDEMVYRIRSLKNVEIIAYMINSQKLKVEMKV